MMEISIHLMDVTNVCLLVKKCVVFVYKVFVNQKIMKIYSTITFTFQMILFKFTTKMKIIVNIYVRSVVISVILEYVNYVMKGF
jgi:hypothetical protein